MTITKPDLFIMLTSVIAFSLYSILIKKHKHKMILMFWANTIAYACFVCMYVVKSYAIPNSNIVKSLEELIFKFTYTNMPFYVLMGITFVSSLVVLQFLLKKYDVSIVMALKGQTCIQMPHPLQKPKSVSVLFPFF